MNNDYEIQFNMSLCFLNSFCDSELPLDHTERFHDKGVVILEFKSHFRIQITIMYCILFCFLKSNLYRPTFTEAGKKHFASYSEGLHTESPQYRPIV